MKNKFIEGLAQVVDSMSQVDDAIHPQWLMDIKEQLESEFPGYHIDFYEEGVFSDDFLADAIRPDGKVIASIDNTGGLVYDEGDSRTSKDDNFLYALEESLQEAAISGEIELDDEVEDSCKKVSDSLTTVPSWILQAAELAGVGFEGYSVEETEDEGDGVIAVVVNPDGSAINYVMPDGELKYVIEGLSDDDTQYLNVLRDELLNQRDILDTKVKDDNGLYLSDFERELTDTLIGDGLEIGKKYTGDELKTFVHGLNEEYGGENDILVFGNFDSEGKSYFTIEPTSDTPDGKDPRFPRIANVFADSIKKLPRISVFDSSIKRIKDSQSDELIALVESSDSPAGYRIKPSSKGGAFIDTPTGEFAYVDFNNGSYWFSTFINNEEAEQIESWISSIIPNARIEDSRKKNHR